MNDGARKTPVETAGIRGPITAIAFHDETGHFILNAYIRKAPGPGRASE
jgi:hypothetical protein